MTFYAYVAQSKVREDYLYKGHCSDLRLRLNQHNAGMTKSIRAFIPFRIIYYESFATREEAIAAEKYWKTAAGRRYLHSVFETGLVVQWIE